MVISSVERIRAANVTEANMPTTLCRSNRVQQLVVFLVDSCAKNIQFLIMTYILNWFNSKVSVQNVRVLAVRPHGLLISNWYFITEAFLLWRFWVYTPSSLNIENKLTAYNICMPEQTCQAWICSVFNAGFCHDDPVRTTTLWSSKRLIVVPAGPDLNNSIHSGPSTGHPVDGLSFQGLSLLMHCVHAYRM